MSEGPICVELYPPGTLGRIFIDVALEFASIMGSQAMKIQDDMLCITEATVFADTLDALCNRFKGNVNPRIVYPLSGRDKGPLGKITFGMFDPRNPLSVVDHVVDIIRKGGFDLLKRKAVAPSLMRVEFYEYARPGIIVKFSEKQKKHMYKEANLLSIALSILGAFIAFIAREDNVNKYFIPSIITSINDFIKIKSLLHRIHGLPEPIQAYSVARKILGIEGLFNTGVLGDLIYVSIGKNRHTLSRWDKVSSEGMQYILKYLNEKTLYILDRVVDTIIDDYIELKRSNYKRGGDYYKILYPIIDGLYKYSVGVEEALYSVVRNIHSITDNMKRSIGRRRGDEVWYKLYNRLKNNDLTDPIKDLEYVASSVVGIIDVKGVLY